jgi:hypothetical protein
MRSSPTRSTIEEARLRTLIYRGGPTGRRTRRLGTADGLDTERVFPAGEPVRVSDKDAERVLDLEPDGFDEVDPDDDDEEG